MDLGISAIANDRKVNAQPIQTNTTAGVAAAAAAPPPVTDIRSFAKGLGTERSDRSAASAEVTGQEGKDGISTAAQGQSAEQLQQLVEQLIQLIQQLIQSMQGSEKAQGASVAGPGGQVQSVDTPVTQGNADAKIPKPTEHIQTLNLGGKQITVGGDGSASAAEVQSTAASISNLYQNSPTFKNMIDNSRDPSFQVSVGRRSDNTSWGAGDGRLFMNINNVVPGNNDTFQSLLGHEFAHASIDLGHGAELEQLQSRVAQEA